LFVLQLPFYLASILVVRLISSLRANAILMWASLCNMLLNIGLNFLFIELMGISGIALSTSIVYAFSFAFVYIAVRRRLAVVADDSADQPDESGTIASRLRGPRSGGG
jgi:putative peptidoglycan lipid II flippase